MDVPPEEGRQITFYFEYDPEYRVVAANSAWVGITTRDDLRLDFTIEGVGNPGEIVNLLTADGQIGPELRRSPERRIVRRFQVGVLWSLDTADSIAGLIKSQVQAHRGARTKQETEGATG